MEEEEELQALNFLAFTSPTVQSLVQKYKYCTSTKYKYNSTNTDAEGGAAVLPRHTHGCCL